jgi:hypothetical protein
MKVVVLLVLLVSIYFVQAQNEVLDATELLEKIANIEGLDETLGGEKVLFLRSFRKFGNSIKNKIKKTYKGAKDTIKAAKSLGKIIKRLKKSYHKTTYKGKSQQCWHLYGNYCGGGYCGGQWWDGCKGRKVDGNTCHFKARAAPIDEVDKCCQSHDDCCSNLVLDTNAGKPTNCNCNLNMNKCFAAAKKKCTTMDCSVAASVMKVMSTPFKVLKCKNSCFNTVNPMSGFMNKIKNAFNALEYVGLESDEELPL